MKKSEFIAIRELIVDEIDKLRQIYASEDIDNHEVQVGFIDSISVVENVCAVIEEQFPFDSEE